MVNFRESEHGPILELIGDLEMATTPTLAHVLRTSLPDPPAAALIVDMRRLEFIDSTGMALLMGLCKRLRAAGQPVHLLIAAQSQPERVLRIASFDQVMTLAYDISELP